MPGPWTSIPIPSGLDGKRGKAIITEVLETKKGHAREFGLGLKNVLRQSIELHHKRSHLPPADYQLRVQQIDEALTLHLGTAS